uniref:Uncharacterized protein n=1 Tax=Siphoviridae sp. ctvod4 TaxID=2827595 RepID=A0A8S5LKM3_9CAUD|nr:MAG TPA: hypothetical protein [Siphoviridae sp. ctvod4]
MIKQYHKQHNYLITNPYQMAKKPSNLFNRFEMRLSAHKSLSNL